MPAFSKGVHCASTSPTQRASNPWSSPWDIGWSTIASISFGGSDSRVASLVLWHFVEEIEHKTAALDVYNAVFGDYFYRLYGLFYASFHVMAMSRRAYRSMLKKDGQWNRLSSRLRLWKEVGRFLGQVLPHMLRCCAPGHDPREIDDPQWVLDWLRAYEDGQGSVPILDTTTLGSGSS